MIMSPPGTSVRRPRSASPDRRPAPCVRDPANPSMSRRDLSVDCRR